MEKIKPMSVIEFKANEVGNLRFRLSQLWDVKYQRLIRITPPDDDEETTFTGEIEILVTGNPWAAIDKWAKEYPGDLFQLYW